MRSLGLLLGCLALTACANGPVDVDSTGVPAPTEVDPTWVRSGNAFTQRDASLQAAKVHLPSRADLAFAVEDPRTGARVDVLVPEASDAVAVVDGDSVVYPGALGPGRDLVQRRTAGGVEDYIGAGDATSIRYTVRLVRGIAGLRLVGDTLEMLDAGGAPRLRAARPRIVDEDGVAKRVEVALHGCAYDADTRAPWGRPVVAPGSDTCELELSWNESDRAVWIDPGWEATGSMSVPRVEPMVTTLSDERVLVVGGYLIDLSPSDAEQGELYDVTTGTWADTASLPDAYSIGTLTALDAGQAIMIGGEYKNGFRIDMAFRYDGAAFSPINLSRQLAHHAAVRMADGRVLVIAGSGDAGSTDELMVFNPATNGITLVGNLGFASSRPSVARFVMGGEEKVLVAGGFDSTQVSGNKIVSLPNAAIIDVASFDVEAISSMPHKRTSFALVPWGDGKIVAVGGVEWSVGPLPFQDPMAAALDAVDVYDVVAKTWTPAAPLPHPWSGNQGVRMSDGSVLVLGGCEMTGLNCALATTDTYRFSLTGAWESAGALGTARWVPGVAALSGDRVLAVGGGAPNVTYPNVDLFSPSLNGEPCSLPSECASQQCVEGVCCDTACGGACESCLAAVKGNGTDGTCGVVPRHENPKGACHTAADCTREECDGAGTCVPVLGMCAPYQCAPETGCLTQCTADAECQQGFACYGGACIDATTLCNGSVGKDRTTGQDVECAPYVCTPDGSCRTSCADSSQCASGRVCNAESRCVTTEPDEDDDKKTEDEGCAIALHEGDAGGLVFLLGAAAAAALARRRSAKRVG